MASINARNVSSTFSNTFDFKVLRQIEEIDIQSHTRSNRSNVFSKKAVSALLASRRLELTEYDK
jgi:hypothetical protein